MLYRRYFLYYYIKQAKVICQYFMTGGQNMRSYTTIDLQYAHRFYGFQGEAQYLHGHSGHLTIEVEDTLNEGVNMIFPCNEIRKIAWEVLQNFDHALILREDDPLLPAILKVYEEIKKYNANNKLQYDYIYIKGLLGIHS